VISPAGGPRAGLAAELTRDGIAASDGPPPAGAIVLAAAADSSGDAHLAGTPGGPVTTWTRGSRPGYEQTHWAVLIQTRPLRTGIADYRFIKVLSAVSHGMSTYPRPERMRSGGEFVAVRVLSGASRTRHAPRAARDLQRSLVVCRSA